MKFINILTLPFKIIARIKWAIYERYERAKLASVGQRFIFDPLTCIFVTPSLIHFGDDCFLNHGVMISGEVHFIDRVLVGPGVRCMSGNHLFAIRGFTPRFMKSTKENPENIGKMIIESDVWIGAGSILVGGVTVGCGSVVGAGSVIVKDLPPFTVCVGNPCRPVRKIFSDEVLSQHLTALGQSGETISRIIERREVLVKGCSLPIIDRTGGAGSFFYLGERFSWNGNEYARG